MKKKTAEPPANQENNRTRLRKRTGRCEGMATGYVLGGASGT